MSERGEGAAVAAVGAAACAVCCAGPLLGVITAIGIGAAAGAWLFGAIGPVIAVSIAVAVLAPRRRGRRRFVPAPEFVALDPPRVRVPR